MFQPLSAPLQNGLRFFLVPLPAAPTVFLAVHLPFLATLRVYPVPLESLNGSDPSSSPAAHRPRWSIYEEPYLTAYGFGPSLSAHLACQQSRRLIEVHICWSYSFVPSSSPPLCWQILRSLAGSHTELIGGYIVPRASHRAVTGSACLGRERLMEQPVSSELHHSVKQKFKRLSGRTSGSRARLPAPSPLRTVRASFPAYGSSLSKASFDTRIHNRVFGVIPSSTAMKMVHLKIS